MTRALIVIDIQNDYFTGGALPLAGASEVEPRICRAITAARAAAEPVILVRHDGPADGALLAQGSPGAALRPAILDAAGPAPIVAKRFADAFQDTGLDGHLRGIDELLICGMMTQNCVLMTALEARARGFETRVIGEFCAAPSEMTHRIALSAIGSKLPVSTANDLWATCAIAR